MGKHRRPWFTIPGVQKGDRTIEEQMTGVHDAVAECQGKTVLDLGCAEGMVGLQFARAGALRVDGVESLDGHLAVARKVCAGQPMAFRNIHLQDLIKVVPVQQYDIVLSLGVCHKLEEPGDGIRFSARSARELCLIRAGGNGPNDGIMRSKYRKNNTCDIAAVMTDCGFVLEKTLPGPRNETVQYWRRQA